LGAGEDGGCCAGIVGTSCVGHGALQTGVRRPPHGEYTDTRTDMNGDGRQRAHHIIAASLPIGASTQEAAIPGVHL